MEGVGLECRSTMRRWSWTGPRLSRIRAWWCGARAGRNDPSVPWSPRWRSSPLLLVGWITQMSETGSKSGWMMWTGLRSEEVSSSANPISTAISISIGVVIATIVTTSALMIATRFAESKRFTKIVRVSLRKQSVLALVRSLWIGYFF